MEFRLNAASQRQTRSRAKPAIAIARCKLFSELRDLRHDVTSDQVKDKIEHPQSNTTFFPVEYQPSRFALLKLDSVKAEAEAIWFDAPAVSFREWFPHRTRSGLNSPSVVQRVLQLYLYAWGKNVTVSVKDVHRPGESGALAYLSGTSQLGMCKEIAQDLTKYMSVKTVIFTLAMCREERNNDEYRMQSLEADTCGIVIGVSRFPSQGELHVDTDFREVVGPIVDQIRLFQRLQVPISVYLDYFWLPGIYWENNYGTNWFVDPKGKGKCLQLLEAGALEVWLPNDKFNGLQKQMQGLERGTLKVEHITQEQMKAHNKLWQATESVSSKLEDATEGITLSYLNEGVPFVRVSLP